MPKNLPMLTVRDFRARFSKLTEPVQVIRGRGSPIEILGTWTPEKQRVTGRTPVRYADGAKAAQPERSGSDKRGPNAP